MQNFLNIISCLCVPITSGAGMQGLDDQSWCLYMLCMCQEFCNLVNENLISLKHRRRKIFGARGATTIQSVRGL